jgi:uncharacterized protein YxjI
VVFKVDGKMLRVRDTLFFRDMRGHDEYNIGEGPSLVAEVSKKWFRIRDTYGVSIRPGQNDIVILAVTVAVDMMAHPGR